MKVTYYWTEDGVGETCDRQDIVMTQPALCYHCDSLIPPGSDASVLALAGGEQYFLHRYCAEKGCTPNGQSAR